MASRRDSSIALHRSLRFLNQRIILSLIFLACLSCVRIGFASAQQKEDTQAMVKDSTLTYASYFFTVPSGWTAAVDENVAPLTGLTGFWSAKHKEGLAWMRIMPHKKDKDETGAEFVNTAKQNVLRNPGCTLDSIQEYPSLRPALTYPYQVYYFDNCPPDTCSLEVFVELPAHVVVFLLEARGNGEECLAPYLEDFRKVLNSFRWTLDK